MIALFVCRLQPMHKGHLHAIKKILEKYDSVLIAVGSSNASRQRSNPFSFPERKQMTTEVLEKEGLLDKCKIIGIPDIPDDEKWAEEIKKYDFDVVVTGNDWTRKCLEADYEIVLPDFLEPEKYNATRIRNIIRLRGSWDHLVPQSVYEFVKKMLDSGEAKIDGVVEKTMDW
ncbi:MAG: adenylyltransferase/cytidyltransferase family protein [Candidatus Aenigmarchaeota archaeon]|nr:adenylyltransferase/cytidyltransferase family protein [Candidatus Aenigmarchaeota archaeon]